MLRLCIQVSMMQMFSPVVNSSDGAGKKKNNKAADNSYDEPAKRVLESPETSSTSKQGK